MNDDYDDRINDYNENTCLVCGDDYGDIADEVLVCGACEDCRATYSAEEILDKIF
jgi:hypothetical protein